MRSGALYVRPTWAPRTDASGSSSSHGVKEWQTPVADDSVDRLAGKINSRGEPKLSAEVLLAWPTPRTTDIASGRTLDERGRRVSASGIYGANLSDLAEAWATPKASEGQGGRTTLTKGGGNAHFDLQVRTWATPRAEDGSKGSRTLAGALREIARGVNRDLPTDVTAWATPTTRDHKDTGDLSNSMVRQDGTPRDDTVPRQAFTWAGPTPPPSEAPTEPLGSSPPKPRRRGLNPRFGLWLMGFPVAWLDSVPSATRSSQPARKSSGDGS